MNDPDVFLRRLLATDGATPGSATNVAFLRSPLVDGMLVARGPARVPARALPALPAAPEASRRGAAVRPALRPPAVDGGATRGAGHPPGSGRAPPPRAHEPRAAARAAAARHRPRRPLRGCRRSARSRESAACRSAVRPARERGRRLTRPPRAAGVPSAGSRVSAGTAPGSGLVCRRPEPPATMSRPPTRRATPGQTTEESLVPTVRETVAEMVQYVFPQYAGAPGQIYGGRMMDWIATAGTLAASRVARGPVDRGRDGRDRLPPPRAGGGDRDPPGPRGVRGAHVTRGRRARLLGERGDRRAPRDALVAHGLRRDRRGGPPAAGRGVASSPPDPGEAAVVEAAQARREARRARLASRAERAREVADETEGFRWRFEQQRFVFPEDALHGTLMFAGACS